MAQFLELCGSVGVGCRLAKTVVVGEDAQTIGQILFVLSYFIRCSNVESSRGPSKLAVMKLGLRNKKNKAKKMVLIFRVDYYGDK